jgi:hypothetical protein
MLAALIGLGCVAHSALFWVGQLTPKSSQLISGLYVLFYILWGICLLFDRSVMSAFRIPSSLHYGFLVWFLVTSIIGMGFTWVLLS